MTVWSLLTKLGAVICITCTASAASADESMTSIVEGWAASAHADITAEAFTHWNSVGEIPSECAFCHSGAGFRSFYQLDGSATAEVSRQIAIGGVIDCDTCHVKGAQEIATVLFPSGVSLAVPALNGTCITCHQGRLSGPGLAAIISDKDLDVVDPELQFQNPHYAAAAATLMGSEVRGAYEYPGKSYRSRFAHVPEAATCIDCHSPHSLQVRTSLCVACHKTDIVTDIRVSAQDFDGDGDIAEGIAHEIATLHAELGDAIMSYAKMISAAPLIYSDQTYPYFFNDSNENGAVEEDEAIFPNRYSSWTPRLLAAAYNYQFVAKDPGGFAHNPHYVMQILIDSVENLRGQTIAGSMRPQ